MNDFSFLTRGQKVKFGNLCRALKSNIDFRLGGGPGGLFGYLGIYLGDIL